MSTATLTRRAHTPKASTPDSGVDELLRFDQTSGPLLAIAGLCGGAGVSTLTYLVATAAARNSTAPVLALDTGGPTAGLSYYARARSTRSLAQLADALAPVLAGIEGAKPPRQMHTTARHGLRLICSDPSFLSHGDPEAMQRVLSDARVAHGLVVCDVGTMARDADQTALICATHRAFMLPATQSGVARARRVLDALEPDPGELLIARCERSESKVAMTELVALADERRCPLGLMPHVNDLAVSSDEAAIKAAHPVLEALQVVLAR